MDSVTEKLCWQMRGEAQNWHRLAVQNWYRNNFDSALVAAMLSAASSQAITSALDMQRSGIVAEDRAALHTDKEEAK